MDNYIPKNSTDTKAKAMPPPGLGIGAAFMLVGALSIVLFVLGFFGAFLAHFFALPRPVEDVLEIVTCPVCYLLVVSLFLRKRGKTWPETFLFKPFNGWVLLPLALTILGGYFLSSEVDYLLVRIAPPPRWFYDYLMKLFNVPFNAFVALLLVAPFTEEPFFRGLMLGGLLERCRPRTGLLVSAALFTVIHFIPCQFPSAFFLGLLCGWVYLHTRSLWPCVIGHALMNLFPFLAGIRAFPSLIKVYPMERLPKTLLVQPLWVDALGVALTAFGLLWLFRVFSRGSSSRAEVKL